MSEKQGIHMLTPVLRLGELVECRIVKRLTRFTLLVEIDDQQELVYTNNTGRLRDFFIPGRKGYCIENKRGKHKYRIIGVEDSEYAALVDTDLQERSFIMAQRMGLIPWLANCELWRRNYRLNNIIVDFAFKRSDNTLVLVELKSAVMRLDDKTAGYPDAPTERGRRQLVKLARYAELGGHAMVVFIVAVPTALAFRLYCCEDTHIGNAALMALKSGVLFKAVNMFLDPRSRVIIMGSPDIPVDLSCGDTCA